LPATLDLNFGLVCGNHQREIYATLILLLEMSESSPNKCAGEAFRAKLEPEMMMKKSNMQIGSRISHIFMVIRVCFKVFHYNGNGNTSQQFYQAANTAAAGFQLNAQRQHFAFKRRTTTSRSSSSKIDKAISADVVVCFVSLPHGETQASKQMLQ